MLSVTCAEALFPAKSTAVPVITWLAPFVETVCGEGHVAIPARLSEQVNVTVTGVVFQIPLGAGDAVALIVGGVLSRLMVTHACADKPALSIAVPQTC